jgi:hypothetical protein
MKLIENFLIATEEEKADDEDFNDISSNVLEHDKYDKNRTKLD